MQGKSTFGGGSKKLVGRSILGGNFSRWGGMSKLSATGGRLSPVGKDLVKEATPQ